MNLLDGVERSEVLVAVVAGLVLIGLVWVSKHLGRWALRADRWLVRHSQKWLTRNKPVSARESADPCDGCGKTPRTVFHGPRTAPDGLGGVLPSRPTVAQDAGQTIALRRVRESTEVLAS